MANTLSISSSQDTAINDQSSPGWIAARLDRLEAWPYPPIVLMMVGITFFFAYFDISNIATVLPSAMHEFHVGKEAAAVVVSLGLWGYIVGGLVTSVIADRMGRKQGFLLAAMLYGVGSVVNGLAWNFNIFAVARFVSGMGIGAALTVISTYMSEISPAKGRGRYMAWTTLPGLVGSALVPWLSFWLVPNFAHGWRVILVLPVVGTLFVLFWIKHFPESPRWLVAHGHARDAERIVAAAEALARKKTGRAPAPVLAPAQIDVHSRGISIIFGRRLLPWTILFFVIWFLNYLPIYGAISMGVTLLVDHGIPLQKSILLTIGYSIGIVLGGLVAPWIADRMPRKWPAFIATVVLGISLILLGMYPSNTMIAIVYFLLAFQAGIFAPSVYLLTAEHFPTAGRATGIAICNAVGHVGGAVAPFFIIGVYQSVGFATTWTVLGIVIFALAIALLPTRNTTGVSLEAISDATPAP
ncbi:hypothetical protein VL15_11005 [Burkholderia cepacia]|uniref:Major facilitator superfamily (MFS) profile domain-containing protein n=1 Tax=Burkholderia cepacia TaxID=292 RepID=A0A0J5X805_BURCE|nr:MFS transporter [Burkholderia cepacia]KML59137.1 hypothetical protein VL15_11005 [Burkholderia cepacia]